MHNDDSMLVNYLSTGLFERSNHLQHRCSLSSAKVVHFTPCNPFIFPSDDNAASSVHSESCCHGRYVPILSESSYSFLKAAMWPSARSTTWI